MSATATEASVVSCVSHTRISIVGYRRDSRMDQLGSQ